MFFFNKAVREPYVFSRRFVSIIFLNLMFGCELFASDDICIVKNDSVTGSPILDGIVENDVGYTKGTRIPLGDVDGGVPTYMGFVRIVEDRTSPHVWLGFDTEGFTTDPGTNDMVALAFSSGGGQPDTYILVQPFSAAGDGSAAPPFDLQLFRVSGGVLGPAIDPTWKNTNVLASYQDSGNRWQMEMKIPKVALGTPYNEAVPNANGVKFEGSHTGGTILFYATVLHTTSEDFAPENMTTTEASWPRDSSILAASEPCLPFDSSDPASANFCNLYNDNACVADSVEVGPGVFEVTINCDIEEAPIPLTSDWANVSLGDRPACEGITLAWSDIGARPVPENEILLTGQNTFFAHPQLSPGANDGPVEVNYKVARWGIPPDVDCAIGVSDPTCWHDISTSAPSTIGSGSQFGATWTLSAGEASDYAGDRHQCIAATMSSTDPLVVFKNDSVRRNMNFVPASVFEQSAAISGKGYGDASGPDGKHRFIVSTRHVVDQYQRAGRQFVTAEAQNQPLTASAAATSPTSGDNNQINLPVLFDDREQIEAMTWVANGYLQRPVVLKLGEGQFKLAEYVGGFGYVASHESVAAKWSQQFSGPTLVPTEDPRVYITDIPPGGESVVHTEIEARDFRLAINGRVGSTYPHGSFNNDFDSDLSYQLGFEYLLNSRYSIEAIFAKHEFSGKSGISDDDVTQISLNGRYYFSQGIRPMYATVGIGNYDFDSSGSDPGVNVGVGFDFEIARRLFVEAAYNYHVVDRSNPGGAFSTLQIGLRYLAW